MMLTISKNRNSSKNAPVKKTVSSSRSKWKKPASEKTKKPVQTRNSPKRTLAPKKMISPTNTKSAGCSKAKPTWTIRYKGKSVKIPIKGTKGGKLRGERSYRCLPRLGRSCLERVRRVT